MTRRPGSRLHGPTRRGRAVAAVLAAIGIALLLTPLAAAQDGASADVVRGAANASADSMSFQIVNGGASLGWTFGRSTAAYRDITTTAEGKSIDLGALGALLSQPQCGGLFPPTLDPETMPPQTVAESLGSGPQGPFEASVSYPQTIDDTTEEKVFGRQLAESSDTGATGSTQTENQDFGFFRVEGATSSATTSFVGGVRRAHAVSTARVIRVLGGLVTFVDPTWTATVTSGNEESEEASFSFKGASVFGNWVSGAVLDRDLAIFETLVEGVLGPLGVDIQFPEVIQPTGGDGIAVTPMSVNLNNAPIGSDLLIPLLNTELLKQYRIDSVDEDCRRETFWTIIDAVERALGGAGSIDTRIGGVEATTDDTDYSFVPVDFGGGETIEAPLDTPEEATSTFDASGGVGEDGLDDFGDSAFEDDFGDSFDSGFEDDFDDSFDGGDFEDSGDFDEVDGPVDDGTGEGGFDELGSDDGEDISDSREVAAADGGNEAAGDAAAIVVGVLALLGAIALSLGDRVMGLRNQHMIDDTDA